MATIKSYTDIKQSKKLAEILPIESADMFYTTNSDYKGKIIGLLDMPLYIGSDGFVDTEMGEIYAWSLAALFDILPNGNMLVKTTDGEYYCLAKDVMTKHYDNSVDACVDMIKRLHELNLL